MNNSTLSILTKESLNLNPDTIILMTTFTKKISLRLLITCNDINTIGLVVYLKNIGREVTIDEAFHSLFSNSIGNRMFFDSLLHDLENRLIIKLK